MRFVTLELTQPDGFHPTNELLDREPSITRIAVHHLQLLADGSLILLYELRGDLERAKAIIGSHSDTLSFDVVGQESGIAYVHGVPTPPVSAFFDALSRSSIISDTPVKIVDNGAQFTFIGEKNDLQMFVKALPDTFNVELLRTGEYSPDPSQLSSFLTSRQREVLQVALREGYYEIPRRATQEDIADILGVTPETVNEHLRKIEYTVLSRVVA